MFPSLYEVVFFLPLPLSILHSCLFDETRSCFTCAPIRIELKGDLEWRIKRICLTSIITCTVTKVYTVFLAVPSKHYKTLYHISPSRQFQRGRCQQVQRDQIIIFIVGLCQYLPCNTKSSGRGTTSAGSLYDHLPMLRWVYLSITIHPFPPRSHSAGSRDEQPG